MADRGGFEPPMVLPPYRISSAAHSTGLCHLSNKPYNKLYMLSDL